MKPSAHELPIIYQDPFLVVVDKPSGLLSVPGKGPDKQDCIVNRLKRTVPDCIPQPSVHRLDMDTSGLMVLALTILAHQNLSRQFRDGQVQKKYVAVLEGVVENHQGEIRLPFRLDVDNRPYQIHDPVHGKLGITCWRKISVENHRSRILFTPKTGRTHQLRVHSAHCLGLGCPIVGDRLYGQGRPGEPLHLHAAYLAFQHPAHGKILQFESEPPF